MGILTMFLLMSVKLSELSAKFHSVRKKIFYDSKFAAGFRPADIDSEGVSIASEYVTTPKSS